MELDYYEALGVEAPESTGAAGENGEVAAPEPREGAEGEKERELAAPAKEQATEKKKENDGQSPEENARYAAIRRRAQQEARRKMEKKLKERIASAGLQTPYPGGDAGGQNVPAGYQGQRGQPYQSFSEESPKGRFSQSDTQRAVAEGVKARLEMDLNTVKTLDPTVKGLEDLSRRPEYPQICRLVEKGLSLPEAYKLVNFDALSRRAADATRQAALNQISGKDHMRQSESRGSGAMRVPADIAEEYRMLLPNVTGAEIQAHYNDYVKR